MKVLQILVILVFCFGYLPIVKAQSDSGLPKGFVYLENIDPSIQQDIRYATDRNFMGRPVRGYEAGRCILTEVAATRLSDVQRALTPFGLTLKVYDCYRPQTAVNDFVAWSEDLHDISTKPFFYPAVEKSDLLKQGYIAANSSHSRGSTVDVTVVPIRPPVYPMIDAQVQTDMACTNPENFKFRDNSWDMGTSFDCFDPRSHTMNASIASDARAHRLFLKRFMEAHGFINLPQEWWHYTLFKAPFPKTYFDFPVR